MTESYDSFSRKKTKMAKKYLFEFFGDKDYSVAENIPKELFIIFDPLDGPHVFRNKREANKAYAEWEEEAANDSDDSFWEMSKPQKFIRSN